MQMNPIPLTHQRLIELLDYNPTTGYFIWKIHKPNGVSLKGKIAGSIYKVGKRKNMQYRYIKIDGKRYKASRLVWFYFHKTFPVNTIDHINRNSLDDRINNLRDATIYEQNNNRKDVSEWKKT